MRLRLTHEKQFAIPRAYSSQSARARQSSRKRLKPAKTEHQTRLPEPLPRPRHQIQPAYVTRLVTDFQLFSLKFLFHIDPKGAGIAKLADPSKMDKSLASCIKKRLVVLPSS